MFTGIIEQTGTLISLKETGGARRITVEAPGIADRLREGDSLAVSGVCLTALDVNETYFHADLAQETLDRTSLGSLAPGSKVNLELPTAAGGPLGGHIVQGHVDGSGTVTALDPVIPETSPHFEISTTDWTLTVRVPESVRPWMVHKGSVAVEGISLTIAPDLLADQSTYTQRRRSGQRRGRCAGQASARPDDRCEKARVRTHRGLVGGQRVLIRRAFRCYNSTSRFDWSIYANNPSVRS